MSVSRTPAVIDALVATFTALGHTVYDGPNVPTTWPTELVIVGGTEQPDDVAAEVTYEWAGLGAKARNETGGVTCTVIVQTGATVIKTDRDRAYVLLGELEAAIVADPTLGAAVESGWLLPADARLTQRQNDSGSYARIVFTVTYQARI